jgi:isoamylase
VLQLLMDSLRYWVEEMHIDGFRFDLASTLVRGTHDVDRSSAFFDVIQQDPIVSQVKLIAEPWDVSDGGYQLGNFPAPWSEWNGKYRDCVRDYWRGAENTLSEFACRISGSPDLYAGDDRQPSASINFVACHDGFTLTDLVSYNDKHNEKNGEGNVDGESNNRSWNCGVEGRTSDELVNELRARQRRNLIATLILSQGVPMILSGDELGRTQSGNNNAYCQDNEESWVDWQHADREFLAFVTQAIKLRHEHEVFRRPKFTCGCETRWYRNDGQIMHFSDWNTSYAKALGMFLSGSGVGDDDFYLAFNAHYEALLFTMHCELKGEWTVVLNTAQAVVDALKPSLSHDPFWVEARSILVLRAPSRSIVAPEVFDMSARGSADRTG